MIIYDKSHFAVFIFESRQPLQRAEFFWSFEVTKLYSVSIN